MKKINTIILILVFSLSLIEYASAKRADYSDSYSSQYNVKQGVKLVINSEFTDIKAYNWDKDIISMEVNVSVDAKNEEKAQKRFNQIIVEMHGDESEVSLQTQLANNYFGRNNNNNLDIEVIIYYPSYISLDLENEFGNSMFEDIDGEVEVEVSYGGFTAENLSHNDNKLETEFGKIELYRFQGGKVEVSYGSFVAEIIGAIRLTSEFSSVDIMQADHLELDTSYDKDYLGMINTAFINAEFSTVKTEKLEKFLRLETAYGSFRINKISKGFQLIDINSEFTGIKLSFSPPLSFLFEADVDMGSFNYPKDLAHITYINKEMMELNIKGYMGNSSESDSKLILNIENATATIKINE